MVLGLFLEHHRFKSLDLSQLCCEIHQLGGSSAMGIRGTHSHSNLLGNKKARQTSYNARGHITDTPNALDSNIVDCNLNRHNLLI